MPSFDPSKVTDDFIEFVESVQTQLPTRPQEKQSMQDFYNSQRLGELITKVEGFSIEEAQKLSAETFVPADEIRRISNIVVANGVGEGFRPMNKAAQEAMEKYGAVGKGFDIHGKSATEGSVLGLVPESPAFSKLGSKDDKDSIHTYEKVNEEALKNPDLGLYTPKSNDGREYYGFVEPKSGLPLKDTNGEIVYAHKEGDNYINVKDGTTIDYKGYDANIAKTIGYVQKDDKGNAILDDKGEPIVRPATADLDQLAQGIMKPSYSANTPEEKMQLERELNGRTQVSEEVIKKIGNADLEGAALTQTLISETKEKGLIRHHAETGNPLPENFADAPHLFIVPKPIRNEDGVITRIKAQGIVCHNEQEIIDKIYNNPELKELNFQVNPLWGWKQNEEGKYEIDPNRVNAQTMYLKTDLIKEEHNPQKLEDAQQIAQLSRERGISATIPRDSNFRRSSQLETDLRLETANYKYETAHGSAFIPSQMKPDVINVDAIDSMQDDYNNTKDTLTLNRVYKQNQENMLIRDLQINNQVADIYEVKLQDNEKSTTQSTDAKNKATVQVGSDAVNGQNNDAKIETPDIIKKLPPNEYNKMMEAAKDIINQSNSASSSTSSSLPLNTNKKSGPER